VSDACVIAAGAVSPFGLGAEATPADAVGEPARVAIARDAVLEDAGLRRPFAARAPVSLGDAQASSDDRATDLLLAALTQVTAALDAARPGWRRERLGIAVGTSSGGMLTSERFFAARAEGTATPELARGATYFAPLDAALAALDLDLDTVKPRTQILAACAASTIAVGLGLRWLDRGACDLVLAGGYDAVSVFVAAGFEVLRATTAGSPRPFRMGRDGMCLGEGAGIVALVREGDRRGALPLVRIAGFGASNDAVHITAPDRTGSGLARAGAGALADAGIPRERIDLVSAHGTSTPFNDAMESRAIASLFGDHQPVVHPFKAQIGHTLGAAGVLEMLAAAAALRSGIAPAAAGSGDRDPDAPALLLDRAEARPLDAALKLSAAFGGTNAALVLSSTPSGRRPRALRPVFLRAAAHVDAVDLAALAEATGVARDRLARLDLLCRLGLGAVAALAHEVGRGALSGAGIIAGHSLATLDTNEGYDARRRARGAASVEPRVFPATSPNAVVGECALVYGLTGPSFAVSAGLDGATEALAAGIDLVAAGDASSLLIVAADDAGPVARDLLALAGWSARPFARGAVALLLVADGTNALRELRLAPDPDLALAPPSPPAPIGHLALLPLLRR
jgi:3-oxoacyl-[acyl-carrier-protein] synthase II